MNVGVAALAPLNAALYLPVTLFTYGTLAAWLARAACLFEEMPPNNALKLTAHGGDDHWLRSAAA